MNKLNTREADADMNINWYHDSFEKTVEELIHDSDGKAMVIQFSNGNTVSLTADEANELSWALTEKIAELTMRGH